MPTNSPTRKVTEVRPSQLIMNFGPGSIMDTINSESLMILGPDYWKGVKMIEEKRLAETVNEQGFGPIERFGIPDLNGDQTDFHVSVRSFPVLKVCRDCGLLTEKSKCPDCRGGGKNGETRPARVVAACIDGHIQDFPWKRWVGCKCDPGKEIIYITKKSGSEESDLTVECKGCKTQRDLTGALEEHKDWLCEGHRPWLGDRRDCDKNLHGVMRGASNVYFTVSESAISIPPYSNLLFIKLGRHFPMAKGFWENKKLDEYVRYQKDLKEMVDSNTFTLDQIVNAFDIYYGNSSSGGLKRTEWERLTHCRPYDPQDDFKAKEIPYSNKDLKRFFECIVGVETLREVATIKGFTRISPYEGKKDDNRVQKLRMEPDIWKTFLLRYPIIAGQVDQGLLQDWLPGVERYGEGIFFQFNRDSVERWLEQNGVRDRLRSIQSQKKKPYPREGLNSDDPRLILVHTFAHHFMREVYMSCGYSTTSLRERIYVDGEGPSAMCGALIYTASMDSEGTLGGLVTQAEEDTMLEHIARMIESARICSQDPLCSSHDPVRTQNAWGASCHSCSQAAETSCEGLQNRLLDRLCLIGNGKWKGYFE
jgi:hypothetical protein